MQVVNFPVISFSARAYNRRNIELCFPFISDEEKESMIAGNFASLGMALVETGIAWFWPDHAVKRLFNVSGLATSIQLKMKAVA